MWEDGDSITEPRIDITKGVHAWPFNPGFPIGVRSLLLHQGGDPQLNRHEYFELLVVEKGQLIFQVEDRCFTMKQGDLLIIGNTLSHRLLSCQGGAAKVVALFFLPKLIRGEDASVEDIEYLKPFLAQSTNFPHVVPAKSNTPARILSLIRQISSELPASSIHRRLAVKTYVKTILLLLLKYYVGHPKTCEALQQIEERVERLRPLLEYIECHYSEPLSVSFAASFIHMSKSHFMRFFKSVTGQAFVTFLHQYRTLRAQSLLSRTDQSIAEVSYKVGFQSQSHFGVVFRRLTHMTPREYRKQLAASAQESP